jgi:hypothetical protein
MVTLICDYSELPKEKEIELLLKVNIVATIQAIFALC